MKVDKRQNIHAFEIQEQERNLMSKVNFAIADKQFVDGLNRYQQPHCQVTLTDDGYRIYRDPNLTRADDGNVMWGGLRVINSLTAGTHIYNPSRDNIFGLQKSHTYIWIFHINGVTHQAPSFYISHQMGNSVSNGVTPQPINTSSHNIGADFSGEKDLWYKFTINDDIIKISATTGSSFTADQKYLSYKDFCWQFGYGSTGATGTDIYITNMRLYDITNTPLMGKITKKGLAKFSSIFEINETIHINKNEDVILNQFIER